MLAAGTIFTLVICYYIQSAGRNVFNSPENVESVDFPLVITNQGQVKDLKLSYGGI